MDLVLSPPRSSDGIGSLTIDEIELLHRNIIASIVAQHGVRLICSAWIEMDFFQVHAAYTILARSLEWLTHPERQSAQSPTRPDTSRCPPMQSNHLMEQSKYNLMSSLGWQQDGTEWRKGPDPWQGISWHLLSLRRGTRSRWVGDSWVDNPVTVQIEPAPFTRGSMRECFRMRHCTVSGSPISNWVAKR